MGYRFAHYEIMGQVAIVTIDHPMNALDVATKEAIGEGFKEVSDRIQEIRAVILHGVGEKAFAAGAEIKTFLELKPDTTKERISHNHQIYSIV
jgi:enoyl-CoA hydratase